MAYVGKSNTKCPYYHHETEKKIFCGNVEDARVALCFESYAGKLEYQQNFCFTFCYKGCKVYQMEDLDSSEE
jgi:hypothetical protein